MQVIEKFVVNRDNLKYIYGETLMGTFGDIQYRIFHNAMNEEMKSVDDFNVTYGTNPMITLYDAMEHIDSDIIEIPNEEINLLLNNVKTLKERFKIGNRYNPSLWGYKQTLLSSIDIYNKLLDQNRNNIFEDYDYERDYNRIMDNDIEDLLERIR